MRATSARGSRRAEAGSALIDAAVAVLIISIGVGACAVSLSGAARSIRLSEVIDGIGERSAATGSAFGARP